MSLHSLGQCQAPSRHNQGYNTNNNLSNGQVGPGWLPSPLLPLNNKVCLHKANNVNIINNGVGRCSTIGQPSLSPPLFKQWGNGQWSLALSVHYSPSSVWPQGQFRPFLPSHCLGPASTGLSQSVIAYWGSWLAQSQGCSKGAGPTPPTIMSQVPLLPACLSACLFGFKATQLGQ